MKCKHYIITRFNLKGRSKDKNGQKVQSDEWLRHRVKLFERYCFPSIKGQTNQNFKWLVLFDHETDPIIYQKYQRKCYNFIPILCDNQVKKFGRYIIDYIKSDIKQPQKCMIITTRIDSDDGFSQMAVNTIQTLAKKRYKSKSKQTNFAINFHRGLYLNEKIQKIKPEFIHFTSAYTSLVSVRPTEISKTVMSYGQGALTKSFPTIWVRTGQPMWVRVIHHRNLHNDRMIRTDRQFNITRKWFSYLSRKYRAQLPVAKK